MLFAQVINYHDGLFKYLTGLYSSCGFLFSNLGIWKIAMLTDNYIGIFIIDATGKFNCTKIAITYPQVFLLYCLQDFIQQGALLCVTIFTWKYIDDHS